jgi:hypothetical protein
MNRWHLNLVLPCLVCALTLSACDPEPTRIVWSPDGSRALVLLPDGLHLCDPQGTLSPLLIAGAAYAEWLPDSRHIVALRHEPLTSWAQVSNLVSEPTRRTIADLAGQVHAVALACQGDWSKFEEARVKSTSPENLQTYDDSLKLFLCAQNDPALRAQFGAAWETWLGKPEMDATVVQTYEVTPASAKPGPILLQGCELEQYAVRIRVSPTGQYVAVSYTTKAYIVTHQTPFNSSSLGVVPTDGSGTLRPISELTSLFVDWTADERYLVFGRTDSPEPQSMHGTDDRARLGSITRHRVTDLGANRAEDFHDEDLASVLYSPTMRVRCLKDGRILFSGVELHLPATTADMPEEESLFVLDPARQATVTNLIPRGVLAKTGGLTDYFEVSPDETEVSLLGPKGEVRTLTLATGDVTDWQKDEVAGQDSQSDPKPRIVPQWRTPNQLTFVRPISNPQPGQAVAEVVLVKRNATTSEFNTLSAHWPASSVYGFLVPSPKPPTTAPASASDPATQP